MGTDFQWQAKRIDDAAISASAKHVLYHIGEWLESQIVDRSDDAQAVFEGCRARVAEAILIARGAEWLAIGAGDYKVDASQCNDAGCVDQSDVLRDEGEEGPAVDAGLHCFRETGRERADQLLKSGKGHLSCCRVFVAEVKFCKEPSSVDQQLDKVHAGTAAETQISDRGQRVTEGLGPRYLSEPWKVRGL